VSKALTGPFGDKSLADCRQLADFIVQSILAGHASWATGPHQLKLPGFNNCHLPYGTQSLFDAKHRSRNTPAVTVPARGAAMDSTNENWASSLALGWMNIACQELSGTNSALTCCGRQSDGAFRRWLGEVNWTVALAPSIIYQDTLV